MKTALIFTCTLFISCFGHAQPTFRDTLLTMESKFFDEPRQISVHLPEEYSIDDTLPVIYFFDAQWEPFRSLINSTVDYLTAIGSMEKSIVVGVHNINRQYELTPESVNEDWQMPSLGGARFLENHLLQEAIPTIELNYATSKYRTGIGHSLGGTFVLNSLIDAPNLFNAYIAVSPNLQLDEEEIALKIIRNSVDLDTSNKFVYTTMGSVGNPDIDFLPSLQKLSKVMEGLHLQQFSWDFVLLDGESHATTPLTSVYKGLTKLGEIRLKRK